MSGTRLIIVNTLLAGIENDLVLRKNKFPDFDQAVQVGRRHPFCANLIEFVLPSEGYDVIRLFPTFACH